MANAPGYLGDYLRSLTYYDLDDVRSALNYAGNFYYKTEAATFLQGSKADSAVQPGQSADLLITGSTNLFLTGAERLKLSNIANNATQNSTDSSLRDRTTHTGAQDISTITNLQTSLDSKASNTALQSLITTYNALVLNVPSQFDTLKDISDAIIVEQTATADALIALSKRPRVDATQTFTSAEKGQVLSNISAGILSGFRNKIINGNFDISQRGTSLSAATGYRYLADRWYTQSTNSTIAPSIQNFTIGGNEVPGEPKSYYTCVVSSGNGANDFAVTGQNIEGVRVLSGKRATLTFYARASSTKNVSIEINQRFGSGGSADVLTFIQKITLTTIFQEFNFVIDIPAILGKTISGGNDTLTVNFWLDAGSSFNSRLGSLGNQSGSFDFSRVSLVEGDASLEADPFSPRHISDELNLCKRYFEKIIPGFSIAGSYVSTSFYSNINIIPKRIAPTVSSTLLVDANYVASNPTGNQWSMASFGVSNSTKTGTALVYLSTTTNFINVNVIGTFSPAPNALLTGSNISIDVDAEY